ncbi:ShlB/FhaC/HecB family hemolysin secretion/activation protein [Croceicoccus marinus]|uniref:Haemolysin activator HlyB C-terminal domain-containing protein n=1 Tax=Croceicoccus marinus TaxID=450378 RepID=A0A7G6VZL6_9SPHN|nr:ShlB/FhaC/HecB family hemolysin secretion/activation protein [Croceicoccus marinus]QNE07181.1 hypothetical protein H4O24_19425 [Croceicoccus marinus]
MLSRSRCSASENRLRGCIDALLTMHRMNHSSGLKARGYYGCPSGDGTARRGYATQKPFLSDFFDSEGHSSQISFRWANGTHSSGGVNQGLQFGFDFKRTDNNLEFSGLRLLDSAVEIFQFPLIYTANIPDDAGETEVQVTAVWSPGNITAHNNDNAFADLIAFSDAIYAYSRFSVTRTTRLPYGMSAVTRAMAQFASTNLPYSEQIGGGGIGSVRGYDTNTALGSQGMVLSQEIRSPAFSLFGDEGDFRDQMQLGAFIDYAWLRQPHRIPDTERTEKMLSVGGGVHYLVGRYLDLQLEVGTQLKAPPGSDDRDTRAAIVATVSY